MKPARRPGEKRTGTLDMAPTLLPVSGETKLGMLGIF
jgi:hypothetical protein